MLKDKIKSGEEIAELAEKLRQKGRTIVTTNGSFDILHGAHVNLLEKARKEGDCLIVLVNSDNSVRRLKGEKRPIFGEDERTLILSALECVDYVCVFDEDNPLSLIEKIKPNKHIKGGSFVKERADEEKNLLAKFGGEFKALELEEGKSTTEVIERILEKYEVND